MRTEGGRLIFEYREGTGDFEVITLDGGSVSADTSAYYSREDGTAWVFGGSSNAIHICCAGANPYTVGPN